MPDQQETDEVAWKLYQESCDEQGTPIAERYESLKDMPGFIRLHWRGNALSATADRPQPSSPPKAICPEETFDVEDYNPEDEEYSLLDRWSFYTDRAGEWRWRFKAGNGEIIGASTEGYKNIRDCEANARMHGYGAEPCPCPVEDTQPCCPEGECKKRPPYLYRVAGWFVILSLAIVVLPLLLALVIILFPILPWFAPYDCGEKTKPA